MKSNKSVIQSQFKETYFKWIKKVYPPLNDNIIDKLSTAYLNFFDFLLGLDEETIINILERIKNKTSFEFSPKSEILLGIIVSNSCESEETLLEMNGGIQESHLFFNAFLIKSKLSGFKNYYFSSTYDPTIGHIVPFSKLMFNDLGLLKQWKFITIKRGSSARIKLTDIGMVYAKSDIMYWLKKSDYEQVAVKEKDFSYNIYESEFLYDKIIANYC